MVRSKALFALFLAGILFLTLTVLAPAPALAGSIDCSADPSSATLGSLVRITCAGFDPNTLVNVYVAEPTGFSEVGYSNYSACILGTRAPNDYRATSKTDEHGVGVFLWYTQNGKNTCPNTDYNGYANQIGTYTVVVQELAPGGIKYAGKTNVTLNGFSESYNGASVWTDATAVSGGWLNVYGSGFAPNEYVNVWFTRPADCSGLGDWYYTGVSAFSPSEWSGGGVSGADSVKADSAGNFAATYLLKDKPTGNAYPCLGQWSVTARAPGSGVGGETVFTITGNRIDETASVWTDEASVPSIGQPYDCGNKGCGIAVHINGSGFPGGSPVSCWFTRPDGVVSIGYAVEGAPGIKVAGDGTFKSVRLTYTSEVTYQGEQPGEWAVTCGTLDGKYVGIAHFTVYALPFLDP